jgi:hypothetical protein
LIVIDPERGHTPPKGWEMGSFERIFGKMNKKGGDKAKKYEFIMMNL